MAEQPGTERSLPGRVRVVIMEDHPLYRFALEQTLKGDAAVEVIGAAGDAHEGVALAREVRPDLVLLDLHLPGRDGLSVLAELAGAADGPRVLVLSADEDPATIADALRAGAAGIW